MHCYPETSNDGKSLTLRRCGRKEIAGRHIGNLPANILVRKAELLLLPLSRSSKRASHLHVYSLLLADYPQTMRQKS